MHMHTPLTYSQYNRGLKEHALGDPLAWHLGVWQCGATLSFASYPSKLYCQQLCIWGLTRAPTRTCCTVLQPTPCVMLPLWPFKPFNTTVLRDGTLLAEVLMGLGWGGLPHKPFVAQGLTLHRGCRNSSFSVSKLVEDDEFSDKGPNQSASLACHCLLCLLVEPATTPCCVLHPSPIGE